MLQPEELIVAGDPQRALECLQQRVRDRPADAQLRVFLFQLLCVLGAWPRSLTQLEVCGDLDAAALPMVHTYRDAIHCELVREAVFAGRTRPTALGQPQAWVDGLIEALQADARGDTAEAERLRESAFDAAEPTPGTLNGSAFDWIADADSRLGPVLEAVVGRCYCWVPFATVRKVTVEEPVDLRDLVWSTARLELADGSSTVAQLPTRYPGSGGCADGAVQLARKTQWELLSGAQYRGLGQRVLTAGAVELGLLQVREIVLRPAVPAGAAVVAESVS
jgi:type VI secretion system protein ImpE